MVLLGGNVAKCEVELKLTVSLRQIHRINIDNDRNLIRQLQRLNYIRQNLAESRHLFCAQHDLITIISFRASEWCGSGASNNQIGK